ncbi:hypothetical protein PUNSTDRAFT_110142 [Punctularia strigosozonata HHB-11173 SS5]|uniref:uncharacterized protein n=1 Tax=Punctularia strigosozonata (strain HHB-11173) TaxID=741275 RepID=UPI00044168A4|nr:uncharacterized protein PUNSTDRAFT_110142 [Punctularia strigosozonata HHB-11173 SS5]EIN13997.1 hypothetical protein PUNSTDRAFT_110142 [Punctularia strigosozonata HHB-11173 SS5]
MQEPIVRSFLDQSEPLTWLKHLERRQPEVQNRLPWLMTARIVEEYCKAHARNDAAMATIPEDSTITGDMSMLDKSPSWNSQNVVRSRPVSLLSLEAARSRTQSSHAYDVSFEPSVESRRHARGSHSIHSINGSSTGHKAAYMVDSPRSSLSSINLPRLPPHGPSPGHSPSNSLSHRRDFAKRFSGRGHDSDDGRSSARESFERSSISDDAQSRPVSGLHTQKQPKAIMRPSALHVPNRDTGDDDEGGSRHDVKADEDLETELPGSSTAKPFPLDTVKVRPPLEYRRSQTEPNAAVPREGTYLTTPRAMRISLPSSDKRPRLETVPSHQRVANEEGEREAYEKKSRLLEDVSAQNHRLRQLLKRVSGIVNEYHDVQTTVAGLSNGTANWISSDVVDAFSHDPAAVSGTARRLRGWKAVEDIHRRIQRQREVLDLFAQSGADEQSLLPDSGLFDPPVKALATLLEQLESERSDIMARAEDVANLLLRVKESHQPTKQEYNETLAHVSVVYPELSQIAVLEESYKDHYQQLWEFGMDVLTLILDTVTPFWRFYGRTIADDVQAFLVIPWYRNEYTGESKRYPIEHLPRRSFRHWIGLLLFGISSVMLAAAEAKVAILATTRYRIPWLADSSLRWLIIPFFWMGTLGLWFAFLIQCCIVGLEAGVIAWWFGWLIRIFS